MNTVTKVCRRCKEEKPVGEFYARKSGDPLSECRQCMKARSKTVQPLPPTTPRAFTEILAIDYLARHRIFALPGKAVSAAWCDVVAEGNVWIEVKYGVVKFSGTRHEYTFNATPAQMERGFIGHLVMLICPNNGGETTFHLFRKEDPVFYIWRDGEEHERLKSGLTYFRGRKEALKHGDTRVVMTDAMMNAAQDNVELIALVRAELIEEMYQRAISKQLAGGA